MAEVYDVVQAREKIKSENELDFSQRTRMTVKGIIHLVKDPYEAGKDGNKVKKQDIFIKQAIGEEGSDKWTYLKIIVSNTQWSQDVGKYTLDNKGDVATFTGKGGFFISDDPTQADIYVMWAQIGDGSNKGGYGGKKYDRTWKPEHDDPNLKRRIVAGQFGNWVNSWLPPVQLPEKITSANMKKLVTTFESRLTQIVTTVSNNSELIDIWLNAVEKPLSAQTKAKTENETKEEKPKTETTTETKPESTAAKEEPNNTSDPFA